MVLNILGDEQYRAGGSSSGSPPASLLVVPQPLTVKPSHPSHLNPHLGGPHPPRKYQCKMCPQVSVIVMNYDNNYLKIYNMRLQSLLLCFYLVSCTRTLLVLMPDQIADNYDFYLFKREDS